MQPTLDHWGNIMMTLSAKGIVLDGDKIWLRKNERDDWEFPGGRVAQDEQPEVTVVREIREELGLESKSVRLVDMSVWHKDFGTNPYVGIITYLCENTVRVGDFEHAGEAGKAEFRQYKVAEALALDNFPEVYKRALRRLT